jgi:hypothetical protein
VLAAQAGPAEPTPECPDDDTIAALAEGTLGGEAHTAAVAHLAGCASCRTAVASVARALADPAVAREVRRVEEGRSRWLYRIALPLAAAAAVVLLIARPRALDQEPSLHRAPTITAAPAPAPASPVGVVSDARVLRWAAVPSADRYRVTLFSAEAEVLYETEVAGTTAALPDSVMLAPGARYLWKVEARTGFDRWTSSELVEFSIARGPPR